MNGSLPNRTDATRLAPKCPPGRSTRKARAFAAEIARLRAQGYTFEAIRAALAEAGVPVSKSTVQREVSRAGTPQSAVVAASGAVPAGRTSAHAPVSVPALALQTAAIATPAAIQRAAEGTELRSGKDIAEAFMRNRITNPLLRAKGTKEPR